MSEASDAVGKRILAHFGPSALVEQKMFGGVGYMLNGNMVAGSTAKGAFMVRVDPDRIDEALSRPGAYQMHMGERPMTGFIGVSDDEIEDDDAFNGWLDFAFAYVRTMPPKPRKPAAKKAPAKKAAAKKKS